MKLSQVYLKIKNCRSWERFTPIILVFLLAVGVRVFHLIEFSRTCPLFNPVAPMDDSYYLRQSAKVFSFSPEVADMLNRGISFMVFLGFLRNISSDSLFIMLLLKVIILSLNIFLIYYLGGYYFNRKTGIIAAFLWALYLPAIIYDTTLSKDSFVTLVNLGIISWLAYSKNMKSVSGPLLAGFLFAVSFLSKESVLLFMFLSAVSIFSIRTIRESTNKILLTAVFFIGMIFPATKYRSELLYDTLVKRTVLEVNVPSNPGIFFGALREEEIILLEKLSKQKSGISSFIFNNMKSNPGEYFKLYLRKLKHTVQDYEIPNNENIYLYSQFSFLGQFPFVPVALVLSLSYISLLMNLKSLKKLLLLYFYVFYVFCCIIFFTVLGRYRLPAIPVLLLFASAGIIEFSAYISKKKIRKAALLVALLPLTVWLVRSEIKSKIRPGDYFMLGMAAARDNNTDIFIKSMHLYKRTKPDAYIMGQILKYRNRFKIQADKNGRPVYVRN